MGAGLDCGELGPGLNRRVRIADFVSSLANMRDGEVDVVNGQDDPAETRLDLIGVRFFAGTGEAPGLLP